LNQERVLYAKQENEYQQTISSLQNKIADMIKQHTKAMDEVKRELHQQRLTAQKRVPVTPVSVPEYVQVFPLFFISLEITIIVLSFLDGLNIK
jgi:hypothetical protein